MVATDYTSSNPISDVPANANPDINSLISGRKWGGAIGTGATIYYSFGDFYYWDSQYNQSGELSGFSALTNDQRANVRLALSTWSDVANINFVEVTESISSIIVGDIRISNSSSLNVDSNTLAYAYGLAQNNPLSGDIWINTNNSFWFSGKFSSYEPGFAGYQTILHEMGHALGLSHPFQEGASDISYINPIYNNFKYSLMSYNEINGVSLDPTTPMMYDIAAIQYLYGANTSFRAGDDTYVIDTNKSFLKTIWDAGGSDTLIFNTPFDYQVFGRLNVGLSINMNAGQLSYVSRFISGGAEDSYLGIAFGVTIENTSSGDGDDVIIGNQAHNTISGNAGNDNISGGDGDDILNGNLGDDLLYGNIGNDQLLGGQGNDQLLGGQGNDILTGALGDDSLAGALGDDTLKGGQGNDQLLGGQGNDALLGALGNDSLTGALGNDILNGGNGNDLLTGGGGADTFVFDVALTSSNVDTITDFVSGIDILLISKAVAPVDGNLSNGGNIFFGDFFYNFSSGDLSFNYSSNGIDFSDPIANFSGAPRIALTDIQLI